MSVCVPAARRAPGHLLPAAGEPAGALNRSFQGTVAASVELRNLTRAPRLSRQRAYVFLQGLRGVGALAFGRTETVSHRVCCHLGTTMRARLQVDIGDVAFNGPDAEHQGHAKSSPGGL